MPSPESLLGEGHLLLRRPRQKGLLRGFSQNVLLSERPLLCAFSSETASSSEKAASSSASSFFLLRRTSHQERFLSARLSLQEFSGKLDLRSLPLRGSPFQKDLLHRRLPSQEHLYRCSVFRFFVTFCSYLFARICFFFNFFYLIIYLLIYFFQDNEANIVLFFFSFSGPCSAATGHKVQKDEAFVDQQSHSVHLSAFEFNQASHFLFWFYRHHMLVPSCRPSDDTLHKLINISFRLHSFPVASRTGTTLFCAFKVEESDTAVPKVPKAYGLEKKQTSNQAGQKY